MYPTLQTSWWSANWLYYWLYYTHCKYYNSPVSTLPLILCNTGWVWMSPIVTLPYPMTLVSELMSSRTRFDPGSFWLLIVHLVSLEVCVSAGLALSDAESSHFSLSSSVPHPLPPAPSPQSHIWRSFSLLPQLFLILVRQSLFHRNISYPLMILGDGDSWGFSQCLHLPFSLRGEARLRDLADI